MEPRSAVFALFSARGGTGLELIPDGWTAELHIACAASPALKAHIFHMERLAKHLAMRLDRHDPETASGCALRLQRRVQLSLVLTLLAELGSVPPGIHPPEGHPEEWADEYAENVAKILLSHGAKT